MIKSLEKYLASELPFAVEKKNEILERIKKLKSDEEFIGTTKLLR
jgi:hypothetical protein